MLKKMKQWICESLALLLVLQMVLWPSVAAANRRIPGVYSRGASQKALAPDAMPTNGRPDSNASGPTATILGRVGNKLTIDQHQQKSRIEWDSFDLDTKNEVFFDQHGNANWVAINRIHDREPSLIFGKVSGNGGKIYLINQNGILFGPDTRISNLSGLVASTLDVDMATIGTDDTRFGGPNVNVNYQNNPNYNITEAFVENQGDITVDNGGQIFLLAPKVANSGNLTAPAGQIALVGGEEVALQDDTRSSAQSVARQVKVISNPGQVTNTVDGKVAADSGHAGMYGAVVNQDGLITSISSVYQNGVVELRASEKITTGVNSETSTPVSSAGDAVDSSWTSSGTQAVTLGGLNIGTTGDNMDNPSAIIHEGRILSPSGTVAMTAEDRIYLGPQSTVDVAGLWSARSASENELTAQLNSPQMSDEFLARVGPLKGAPIKFNALEGSDLGHINGYLDPGQLNAVQRHTKGGSIQMKTTNQNGSVIARQGAKIDFSGGGWHFTAGRVNTTKVRIGNQVFDIGDIPDEALDRADQMEILSDAEAARYAATYIPDYDQGDDAGTLKVETSTLMLNGSLKGNATVGMFQTEVAELNETIGNIDYQLTMGRRQPDAGKIFLGNNDNSGMDVDRLTNVVIQDQVAALPVNFDPENDVLQDTTSYLSASLLSDAGIGSLRIYANYGITTKADASLVLAPTLKQANPDVISLHDYGLQFIARRIDHGGEITQAGGKVVFHNDFNITSGTSIEEGIWLRSGSIIDVGGQDLNFRNDPYNAPHQQYLAGGAIQFNAEPVGMTLVDIPSRGVFVESGAQLNVDGGYYIDPSGRETGADAGSLTMVGESLVLDGNVTGYAMLGYEGASFSATSFKIGVAGDDSQLTGMQNSNNKGFYVRDDWFANNGFSRIALISGEPLEVGDQARLSTSNMRYTLPQPRNPGKHFLSAPDNYLAPGEIKLTAGSGEYDQGGAAQDAPVVIGSNAEVSVSPGGRINLGGISKTQNTGVWIKNGARLVARGGEVNVTAKDGDIVMDSGSTIDVRGYNRQEAGVRTDGLPQRYRSYAGGKVSLSAPLGTLRISPGVQIDVSGSNAVSNYYRNDRNRAVSYGIASEAGVVDLTANILDLQGRLRAQTHMANLNGGSLTITSTDSLNPYHIQRSDLENWIAGSNFDDLAIRSLHSLIFDESITLDVGRSLILDAPEIGVANDIQVSLEADYIGLENTLDKFGNVTSVTKAPTGRVHGGLNLISDWMDITGEVALSSFATVNLSATYDMVLSNEAYYHSGSTNIFTYSGKLSTYADIALTAGRIYPTTDTRFTISALQENNNGVLTGGSLSILNSGEPMANGPILSANGYVELQANDIRHEGRLMVPMGQIVLRGTGSNNQVYQSADSVLSTASDTAVPWGYYDGDRWMRWNKEGVLNIRKGVAVEVTEPPQRSIDILAETVDAQPGSIVDLSGGGTVYGMQFQPSVDGSADPLNQGNRYVIMTDQSVRLPGKAVYLSGISGIPAGYYSLLPDKYAFLPGAVVIEDQGAIHNTRIYNRTLSGYVQDVGYAADMGSGHRGPQPHRYLIRSTADVLQEGSYQGLYQVAGDGGNLTVNSLGGSLQSTYAGGGLNGYKGGVANIGGHDMVLTQLAGAPDASRLYFNPQSLIDAGFNQAVFGYVPGALDTLAGMVGTVSDRFNLLNNRQSTSHSYVTNSITVYDLDLNRTAGNEVSIALNTGGIDFQNNVNIDADELILAASSQSGIQTAADTSIYADRMGILADNMDLDSRFTFGSTATVASTGSLELVDASMPAGSGPGVLRVHAGAWSQFRGVDAVALAGNTNITAVGRVDTGAREFLYVNTPLITGSSYTDTVGTRQRVDFSAPNILIANTGSPVSTVSTSSTTGELTFTAFRDTALENQGLETGRLLLTGNVAGMGTRDVEMVADKDLILAGAGNFRVDGDLTFTAGRVTAGYVRNLSGEYEAADFKVAADFGRLTIGSTSGQNRGAGLTPGGLMRFQADTIEHQGIIDNFAGGVAMKAQNGLYLRAGSLIEAYGDVVGHTIAGDTVYEAYGAGWVELESQNQLVVEGASGSAAEARIDVSHHASVQPAAADTQTWSGWVDAGKLDAGSISISAPQSATQLDGSFSGHAAAQYIDTSGRTVNARGGSFGLIANTVDGNNLASKLSSGGFNHQVQLRGVTGNIDIAAGNTLTAEQIKLVADSGAINVGGLLDASGYRENRSIELYAGNDINILAAGRLDASTTAGWNVDGGDVTINSTNGFIRMYEDPGANMRSSIDVTAGGSGIGGQVHLRASRYDAGNSASTGYDPNADDVRIDLSGDIIGASRVSVEAVRVYDDVVGSTNDYVAYNTRGQITNSNITNLRSQTSAYMTRAQNAGTPARLQQNLVMDQNTSFTFMPGIEITRNGDIILNANWDMANWRYGTNNDIPGRLVLRASNNLTISADLIDHPHTKGGMTKDANTMDSWGFTFAAGADLAGADPMSTVSVPTGVAGSQGKFEIDNRNLVFTESGPIGFASGGNTVIGQGARLYYDSTGSYGSYQTSYTLATHDGDIFGDVHGNLTVKGDVRGINAGAIQSAKGIIDLKVGGDLILETNSAVRTTGVSKAQVTRAVVSNSDVYSWYLTPMISLSDSQGNPVYNTPGPITDSNGNPLVISIYEAIYGQWQLLNDPSFANSWMGMDAYNNMEALTLSQFSQYAHGGNLNIKVGGNVQARISENAFFRTPDNAVDPMDPDQVGASYYYDSTNNYKTASGIIAMAGGDIDLQVRGSIARGNGATYGLQVAAFDQGDISVHSGGDIEGRFLIEDGRLSITTMESFGMESPNRAIEVIDTAKGPAVNVDISAQGDIYLGSVLDPIMGYHWATINQQAFTLSNWSLHYTESTALNLNAIEGSIALTNQSEFYQLSNNLGLSAVYAALPPTVEMNAGKDIVLFSNSNSSMWLAPSATGNLTMIAGEDIYGNATTVGSNPERDYAKLYVSNLAPEQIYHHLSLPGIHSQLTYADYARDSMLSDLTNGYTLVYKAAFGQWWSRQDSQTQSQYSALRTRVNDPGYLLHAGDTRPVVVKAGGDITNMALKSPKKAEITSQGTISDIYLRIQHATGNSAAANAHTSVVAAKDSIAFSVLPEYYGMQTQATKDVSLRQSGLELAGPGTLIVTAGHDVDLGFSAGLRTVGSIPSNALASIGGDIIVCAGYEDNLFTNQSGTWAPDNAVLFFNQLQQAGVDYSSLKYGQLIVDNFVQTADIGWARQLGINNNLGAAYQSLLSGYGDYADVPQDVRDQLALDYLGSIRQSLINIQLVRTASSGGGSSWDSSYLNGIVTGIDFQQAPAHGAINMTQAQIYTQRSGDIYAITAGDFDVGISAFADEKADTGINSMRGGNINIYTYGDLNVNESRIMTWYGGNIMAVSDYGSINAGKGSKTTVSVSDPVKTRDATTGQYKLEYTLPAVGSGIRLLTYDPDGIAGPSTAPLPGDGYFFAFEGEIDAGEAGIAGQGNLLLVAPVVLNSDNIDVGGLSVGADISQDADVGVGNLTGDTGLSDAANQTDQDNALTSAKDRFEKQVNKLSESLVPSWLAVTVTGFVEEEDKDCAGLEGAALDACLGN